MLQIAPGDLLGAAVRPKSLQAILSAAAPRGSVGLAGQEAALARFPVWQLTQ
jgi:hypothetical protein